jgi:hypothetical protein
MQASDPGGSGHGSDGNVLFVVRLKPIFLIFVDMEIMLLYG